MGNGGREGRGEGRKRGERGWGIKGLEEPVNDKKVTAPRFLLISILATVTRSLPTWAWNVKVDVLFRVSHFPFPLLVRLPPLPLTPSFRTPQAFAAQNAKLSMEAHNAKAAALSMR